MGASSGKAGLQPVWNLARPIWNKRTLQDQGWGMLLNRRLGVGPFTTRKPAIQKRQGEWLAAVGSRRLHGCCCVVVLLVTATPRAA